MRLPSLRNRRPAVYVFLSLTLLFGLFILVSSCLPGDLSAAQSAFFTKLLNGFLSLFVSNGGSGGSGSGEGPIDPSDGGTALFVRKLFGHGSLFALYGLFLFLFLYFYLAEEKALFALNGSLSGSLFLACLTELIQLAVPGRVGSLQDVGIDMIGAIVLILFAFGIVHLVRFLRNKKKAGEGQL